MTQNLMFRNDANDAEARLSADWAAVKKIANNDGNVFISDELVTEIARILDDAPLSNGERVTAYSFDDDDLMPSYVSSFGPSLLGENAFREVRTLLETESQQAADLFDLIAERGLQVTLCGKDFCEARIHALNWPADEVEINRTATNMARMLEALGIETDPNSEEGVGEVTFDVFEQAVSARGTQTDFPAARLSAFVECARRNGATHIYWG